MPHRALLVAVSAVLLLGGRAEAARDRHNDLMHIVSPTARGTVPAHPFVNVIVTFGTAANGDKYYVRFDGTTNLKGETPTSGTCTFTFTGGTGKLRGLTGKGTCTGTFDATGAAVFDVVGEYSIAAAKTK